MTSSRSFRASIMPSMLRSNTDPDSSSSTRKSVKKSNTSDLAHLRGSNIGSSKSTTNLPHMGSNSQQDQDAVQHNRPRSAEQKTIRKRNDSTQKVSLPKSQSTTNLSPTKGSTRWRNRLSSFLPSLVLPSEPTPKSVPTPPVPAAPSASASAVTAAVSPAPTKSSSPTDTSTTTNTAATPPTTVDDSASSTTPSIIDPTVRMTSDYHDALPHQAHGQYQPGHAGSPPSPDSIPTRGSDSLDGSLNPQPQIMAPIPPSPEVQRATMSPQEPNMPPPPIPTSPSDNVSSGGGKLRKENPAARSRSGSLQHTSSNSNGDSIQALKTRQTSPVPDRGRRSSSVQSPNSRNNNTKSRVVSTPLAIRPGSSKGDASQSPTRGRLRRSWLPGGRSRSNSMDVSNTNTSTAWVLSDDTQAEYNASFLKNGEKVPELWNESGAVLVYLYPKGSGFGPSFKVQEFTISSSWVFNELIQREREMPMGRDRTRSFSGRDSLTAEDANRFISPPNSPPAPDDGYDDCLHLYLPNGTPGQETPPDMGRLIAIRNLFAFLTGQPLVATKARPTNFHAFLEISKLLEEYGFTSYDGTTFGDAVDLSFGFYMDQHALADCRNSREKTLEALILGERMRSADLYNEAFAHAAGKLPAIQDLKLPLWNQVSEKTRTNLERASTDLNNRQHNANMHLEQFEFPALFSGIANSTSMSELRSVRFKVWKQSFTKMRNFALSYYKTAFGNWPPKASSKKNPFSESGLNRLVLKVLYSDMCALYDLLVDRTNRTSRIMDAVPELSNDPDKMIMSALRNIMSEFDRSKPPVLPPIPYDCPQLPTATSILETYDTLSPKKQAKFDKSIKEHELMLMLNKAYNYDTNATKVPFLDKFKEFELREARGKTPQDFADQRIGYWLFLYVVIQSLPVLVVDAPGMQFTEGVEYFLCEPPLGNPPWVPDQQVKKMWYEVAGTGGLVELSQDAVLFSVEATYHRSHCWLAATQWESGASGLQAQAPTEPSLSPLQPPRSMFLDEDFMPTPPPSFGNGYNTPPSPIGSPSGSLRPRTHSPGGSRANQAWRSSIALGLEPVPLQPPSPFGERSSSLGGRPPSLMMGSRNSSVGNLAAFGHQGFPQTESPPPEQTGATFDDILRSDAMKKEKKKSRFF
ncbi:hypothetical protein IWW34DRAFT_781967 [Fusarium oxysporum f. sp. albedinis]|nr:hypothetical protein IWW34DRAFT_781967 [Fusarium oxysporum f. sp. albedinis]KAJ0145087.1 hypothetical protein HZ326_12175 [Fusarium oxysporum f. sp. albedinis]KAK2487121.1 hypothetical protein H9L39_01048 [Fusarium oxysporum f. sp. albedinis]